MVIEISKKFFYVLLSIILSVSCGFVGGYYFCKKDTVSKAEYTTARQYSIYTSEMLKALYSDLGEPNIDNIDFWTNARAIATLKAKATGKKYSEVKGLSYTLDELLDVNALLKEE